MWRWNSSSSRCPTATPTLSIAPEGKFPVRRGTADDPTNCRGLGHAARGRRPQGAAGRPLRPGDDRRDRRRPGRRAALGRGRGPAGARQPKMINSQVINRMVRAVHRRRRSTRRGRRAMNEELAGSSIAARAFWAGVPPAALPHCQGPMTARHPPPGRPRLPAAKPGWPGVCCCRPLISVALVVVLPLLAIFWISVKPIGLADLRPTAPMVREQPARSRRADAHRIPAAQLEPGSGFANVVLTDTLPDGSSRAATCPPECTLDGRQLTCASDEMEGATTNVCAYPSRCPPMRTPPKEAPRSEPRTGGRRQHPDQRPVHAGELRPRLRRRRVLARAGVTLFYTFFGTDRRDPAGPFRGAAAQPVDFRDRASCAGCSCFPTSRRSSRWPLPGSSCSIRSRAGQCAADADGGDARPAINFFGQRPWR
jgi:hypothetical protein